MRDEQRSEAECRRVRRRKGISATRHYAADVHGRRHLAKTTLAAAALIAAVTTAFLTYLLRYAGHQREGADLDASLLGLNSQQAQNAAGIARVLIVVVSLISVLLLIGILRRRQGARFAAIGVFGMLAIVVGSVAWTGLSAHPPAPNALYGLACGVVDALIAGLLLAPATADDFDEAEHERQWLRTRGVPLSREQGDNGARPRGA